MWRMGRRPGTPAGATVEGRIRAARLVLGKADSSSLARARIFGIWHLASTTWKGDARGKTRLTA
jgi:hypothetical protein